MSVEFPFSPLHAAKTEDVQKLGECLWKWHLCGNCSNKESCTESSCPWSRKETIRSALNRYKRLTSYYMPEYFATRQALSCHGDLLEIIKHIKDCPNEAKEQLMEDHFNSSANLSVGVPVSADQDRAFNLAASVLLLLNCGVPDDCADQIEDCNSSITWASGISMNTFVAAAFEKSSSHAPVDSSMLKEMSVKRLRHKAGLTFEATDDLRSHLRLDLKRRVVYVFGCTSVLEEILSASIDEPAWCILPRELILEVLNTIYKVLFPAGRDSKVVLSSLVRKGGFDKDLLRYTIERFRRDDDPEVDYSYFGDRLAELHQELKDPSPRNWFERLFEGGTKSAERKMLMATTIGVFIAVTIGLFGLGIAGFQAWIGYQQWKHPVKDQ